MTLLDSSGPRRPGEPAQPRPRRRGALGLICPHRRLRRVFEITGLRRAFVFGDDLDGVRAALAEDATPPRADRRRPARPQADPRRAGARRGRPGPPRARPGGWTSCSRSTSAARALRTRVEALRAERSPASARPSARPGGAGGDSAGRGGRGPAPGRGAGRAARPSCARSRPAATRCSSPCPTWPRTRRPTAARTTRSSCGAWASRRPSTSRPATTSTSASAARAGPRGGRRASRARASPTCWGRWCALQLALVALRRRPPGGRGASRPVVPPVLVREEAMFGTGFFPTDRASIYRDGRRRPLPGRAPPRCRWPACTATRSWPRTTCPGATWASPPASGARPARRARTPAASSACTSSTRSRCSRSWPPEDSRDEHQRILGCRRRSCRRSSIPYRVVDIAVGDLGAPAARKFDLEAWLPGQGALPRAHLLLQLHRLPGPAPARARSRRGAGTETLHTLNGTAVAVGRTIIAHPRERPARGRLGRRPGRPAALRRPAEIVPR